MCVPVLAPGLHGLGVMCVPVVAPGLHGRHGLGLQALAGARLFSAGVLLDQRFRLCGG